MGASKSQGPSRGVLIGSAIVLIVILVGSSYWTNTQERDSAPPVRPAASVLQPLLDRCEEPPEVEQKGELLHTRCSTTVFPEFVLSIESTDGTLERAALMVRLGGTEQEVADRRAVGLELFSLVAGVPVEQLLTEEQRATVGASHVEVARDGLRYVSDPSPFGVAFSVRPDPLY